MSHQARRRFGQNFLTDGNTIARILTAIAPAAADHIVEIGPGQGALTAPLLDSGCQLSVVEIDRDLAAQLRLRFAAAATFRLIEGDALKLDYATLQPAPLRIVGNLPYNISTPLLFHILRSRALVRDMHFMLQKEVVDRMVATPGGRDYGRLSVAIALRCRCTRLLSVPPGAFVPAPKVDSAVVRLEPFQSDESAPAWQPAQLDRVLLAAFSARRKTLRNALKSVIDADTLCRLDIDPTLRPEQIHPAQFAAIAEELGGSSVA